MRPPISADYDSPWKEALDAYFEAFLALLFPKDHRQIDWLLGNQADILPGANPRGTLPCRRFNPTVDAGPGT